MRIFEILLLVVNVPYVGWPLFAKKRPYWLHFLPLTAVLLTVLHLLIEKYRWQMVPAYVITAVLAVLALLRLTKPAKPASKWLAVGGLFVLGLAFVLPILIPVPQLPAATGPYPIGTQTVMLVDNGRTELWSGVDEPRRLMAQIWYPAAPTGSEPQAQYLDAVDEVGAVVAEMFNLPSFMFDHVNLTDLGITVEPPAATDGPFPVILFSHGLTGLRGQNTTMVRELVSHGYVVAAVDHTYGNAITVFPDGETVLYDACRIFSNCDSNYVEAIPLVDQWVGDLDFLLNILTMWNSDQNGRFAGVFDLAHVGVFGHSTGGGAAVSFCQQDARCSAGVGLDAWVLPIPDEVLAGGLQKPFMFLSTPHWLGDENRAKGEALLAQTQVETYDLRLANTGHFDFTDLVLLTPLTPQLGLSGTINSQYSLTIQNEYALAFFDHYLRGMSRPVLTAVSPYPELTISRKP